MANEKVIEPVGVTLDIGALTLCYVSLGSVGFAARDAIDNTCLSNVEFITKQPQALKENADIPFTAFYQAADYSDLEGEINKNQQLDIVIPAIGTLAFWGFLQSAEVSESGVGDAWQVTGNIVVTNINATGVETGPTFTVAP